jgi:hypothetical protein
LAKTGSTFTGSYSADGLAWTALPAVTNTALSAAKFGVYAFGADQVASKTARFDYFKLVRDTVAPSVNLSLNPSTPSGLAGWWIDPVVATAMATDDQAGQLYLEQKVGAGEWSEYTAPVTISTDGTHTIQVRASDTAGNVSPPETVTVKIDRTPPTIALTGLSPNGSLGVATVVSVAASTADALSGPGAVTLAVDGQPSTGRVEGAALGLGPHALTASTADVAGNKSVTAIPFTVVASYPEAVKLVDRFRAEGKVPAATATVLKVQLGLAAEAVRRGRDRVAAVALDSYLAKARTVQDVAARALLIAVGNDLKGRLA